MSGTNTKNTLGTRRIILLALGFMLLGTVLELYLLGHYEDFRQLIPMLCIGASAALLAVLHLSRAPLFGKLLKWVLAISALSGLYGTFLHLRANYEFESEMKPSGRPWELFTESLSGALPALAPLSMIVLALLGYAYLQIINQES